MLSGMSANAERFRAIVTECRLLTAHSLGLLLPTAFCLLPTVFRKENA